MHQQTSSLRCQNYLLRWFDQQSCSLFSFASEYSFHSLLIWFTDFYQFFVFSAHLKRNDSTIHLPISKFVTKYKIYPLFFSLLPVTAIHTIITLFLHLLLLPLFCVQFCLCCVFQLFAPIVCFLLPFLFILQQIPFPLNPTNHEPTILLCVHQLFRHTFHMMRI